MRAILIFGIAFGVIVTAAIWALAIGFSGYVPWWPDKVDGALVLYGPPALTAAAFVYAAKRWSSLAPDWTKRGP